MQYAIRNLQNENVLLSLWFEWAYDSNELTIRMSLRFEWAWMSLRLECAYYSDVLTIRIEDSADCGEFLNRCWQPRFSVQGEAMRSIAYLEPSGEKGTGTASQKSGSYETYLCESTISLTLEKLCQCTAPLTFWAAFGSGKEAKVSWPVGRLRKRLQRPRSLSRHTFWERNDSEQIHV